MQTQPQTFSDAQASLTRDLALLHSQCECDRTLEFESLLARELPRFQRMAMRWLRNREDAEDAVQDAVLSAFMHIESFEGRARMSSWLMSILLNSVKMQLRKRTRKMRQLDQLPEGGARALEETIFDPGPDPEQICQRSELHGILTRSVGKLSAKQRTALQLFEFQRLSLKETAQALGLPVGTVKAQVARGRGRLGRKLRQVLGARTRSHCLMGSLAKALA